MTSLLPIQTVAVSHGSFQSGGVSIPYDLYRGAATHSSAAVVLLHGADGMQYETWSRGYQRLAHVLAENGFVVLVPRYFARTNTTRGADRNTIVQNFLPWAETVSDAVTTLSREPGVDPKRIGLVGISLGASLANSEATQDPRIGAVVDCFGTLPELAVQLATRFAPTLILHGSNDPIVPVSNATDIANALKAHGVPYEMKIYPDQGHGFTGAALADAERRTISFLTHHLS